MNKTYFLSVLASGMALLLFPAQAARNAPEKHAVRSALQEESPSIHVDIDSDEPDMDMEIDIPEVDVEIDGTRRLFASRIGIRRSRAVSSRASPTSARCHQNWKWPGACRPD